MPLDIDVLLYGELVGNFDGLVLPRAEILKNAFVLWPLSLMAPEDTAAANSATRPRRKMTVRMALSPQYD